MQRIKEVNKELKILGRLWDSQGENSIDSDDSREHDSWG